MANIIFKPSVDVRPAGIVSDMTGRPLARLQLILPNGSQTERAFPQRALKALVDKSNRLVARRMQHAGRWNVQISADLLDRTLARADHARRVGSVLQLAMNQLG